MNKALLSILSLLLLSLTVSAKRIYLPVGVFYYFHTMTICSPGDTLVIKQGNYGESALMDVQGTSDKPVVITNEGIVKMGYGDGTRYGLKLEGKYFKLIGDTNYGFQFTCPVPGVYSGTSIDFNNSSNYEIAYLDIGYTQLGLRSNPNKGGLMDSINIHHIRFHHTGNPGYDANRCEAIYFGNTDMAYSSETAPMRFRNLHIHHCSFDSLMGDGIQIAIAESFRLDHDTVTNSGLNNLDGQFTCFLAGGCTQGTIDSCIATNCNGPAVQVFGYGKVYVTNNRFVHCGQYKGNNQDIIYISSKCPDGEPLQTFITGNYIDGGNRFGINNETEPEKYKVGIITNNEIKNTLSDAYSPFLKESISEQHLSFFTIISTWVRGRKKKVALILAAILVVVLLIARKRFSTNKLEKKTA